MQKEIRIFFTALMFFTRIPCPSWVDHSEEYLNKSSRYFPLMGWIVGGIAALVILTANFIVPTSIVVLLSMIASILTTGAFHEDGFADMCDGFGGGWTKERILEIMQDSRLGTFGACGLALILALKYICLIEIIQHSSSLTAAIALVAAHSASRLTAVSFLKTHSYARLDGDSKAKPLATELQTTDAIVAFVFGILPSVGLTAFLGWNVLFRILPLVATKWYLGRFFVRWIGGYTGDCLGATQQVAEVLFYATFVAILHVKTL